ncbi:hypothetical protein ABPG75_013250 [Micractinium tetrahymenae]
MVCAAERCGGRYTDCAAAAEPELALRWLAAVTQHALAGDPTSRDLGWGWMRHHSALSAHIIPGVPSSRLVAAAPAARAALLAGLRCDVRLATTMLAMSRFLAAEQRKPAEAWRVLRQLARALLGGAGSPWSAGAFLERLQQNGSRAGTEVLDELAAAYLAVTVGSAAGRPEELSDRKAAQAGLGQVLCELLGKAPAWLAGQDVQPRLQLSWAAIELLPCCLEAARQQVAAAGEHALRATPGMVVLQLLQLALFCPAMAPAADMLQPLLAAAEAALALLPLAPQLPLPAFQGGPPRGGPRELQGAVSVLADRHQLLRCLEAVQRALSAGLAEAVCREQEAEVDRQGDAVDAAHAVALLQLAGAMSPDNMIYGGRPQGPFGESSVSADKLVFGLLSLSARPHLRLLAPELAVLTAGLSSLPSRSLWSLGRRAPSTSLPPTCNYAWKAKYAAELACKAPSMQLGAALFGSGLLAAQVEGEQEDRRPFERLDAPETRERVTSGRCAGGRAAGGLGAAG